MYKAVLDSYIHIPTRNKTLIPERHDHLSARYSTLDVYGFPVWLNCDGSKLQQVNLQTLETLQSGGGPVPSVDCQKGNTIIIAVVDLKHNIVSQALVIWGCLSCIQF